MPDAIDLGSRHLHGSKAEGVLRVVIDRPERRNALTIEMYHGIKKAAVLAERDPAIDVLLVTATGDYFCVGGEMGGRHEGGAGLDRETDGIDLLPFVQFERCPKIVVLGINGMCQGGGLNLTLTAHLAVASEPASFPRSTSRCSRPRSPPTRCARGSRRSSRSVRRRGRRARARATSRA